ncbi:MAG: inorganic phosphate transporter [Deltaproteobacteria bacterium]|nr:inorganic phosphate transporter [Deltaproteobacteria bacterium]
MDSILLLLVVYMAFYNGANDVSKGVATLCGSGLCGYRTALLWGAIWTVAGGITACFLASGLFKVFSNGIVSSDINLTVSFSVAVAIGVSTWVLLATKAGMPVSTTHSIVGSICGPVLFSMGPSKILWGSLGYKVLIPLLLSPVVAILVSAIIYKAGYGLLSRLSSYCLCIETRENVCCDGDGGVQAVACGSKSTLAKAGTAEDCAEGMGSFLRMDLNDMLHWISSALISFARALNDTPKIVAVLFASTAFAGGGLKSVFLLAALFMGLGSYLKGVRVTETLSNKITAMDRHDGVMANTATALLVLFATKFGMPVSTTHVSGGSIIGIGLKREDGTVNKKIVSEMLLAWLVTLPAAGAISGMAYMTLNHLV